MTGVSSLGVGSGLDLQSLVDGLVSAEAQVRLTPLAVREANATEQISAFGLLTSSLSEFNSSLTSLADFSDFQERNVSVSNEDAFTVSADLDAPLGSFDVDVLSAGSAQLLTATGITDITGSLVTAATTDIGGGEITIQQGGGQSFSIAIPSTGSSLDEIAAAINTADDNSGVSAAVITGDAGTVLVLSATDVGSDNAISVTVEDLDGNGTDTVGLSQLAFTAENLETGDPAVAPRFIETEPANDAQIIIAGQTITSSSGATFADAITGISITANAETEETESFSVSSSTTSAVSAVNEFIESFNTLIGSVDELGQAGGEDFDGGPLVGDAVLRGLRSQLNTALFTSFNATLPQGVRSLSDIGISFGNDGTLSLDTTQLNDRLDTQFSSVVQLFASTGENIAQTQELQSVAYANLATQPGDATLNFSQGSGDDIETFSIDLSGLDLAGARDAINAAGDNFGITASLALDDDGNGGSQVRLILSSDSVGSEFTVNAVDNVSSNELAIFSELTAAETASSTGIVAILQSIANGYLGLSGETGIIEARTDGLDATIDRIEDDRLRQEQIIESFQQRLVTQFASLDLLVSNLTSSGQFLISQLNSISQISNNSSN